MENSARKREQTRRLGRERAWRVATIAFCHVPSAGEELSKAALREYEDCLDMDVAECTLEIEKRFLETPVDTLAEWLDWTVAVPRAELVEAKRLVEEARLLAWVHAQNDVQGVSPPPSSSGRHVALCPSRIAASLTPEHHYTNPLEVQVQRNGCSDSDSAGAWPCVACRRKTC